MTQTNAIRLTLNSFVLHRFRVFRTRLVHEVVLLHPPLLDPWAPAAGTRRVQDQLRQDAGMVMLRAARRQGVNVHRLSFADTLAWLRHGDLGICPDLKINPLRPGRLEPRVIKRQKKEFPYMMRPRVELKSQLRARHCDTT